MSGITERASPGWPEIIMGLIGLTIVAIGGVGLVRLGIDPVVLGLFLTALSGVGGMAGFFAD